MENGGNGVCLWREHDLATAASVNHEVFQGGLARRSIRLHSVVARDLSGHTPPGRMTEEARGLRPDRPPMHRGAALVQLRGLVMLERRSRAHAPRIYVCVSAGNAVHIERWMLES